MNKWFEIILGLIILVGAILLAFYSQNLGIWNFWNAAGQFLKGGIFWLVIMIGFLLLVLGISDLKE